MPFTSETAKLYGGARPNAGRPSRGELDALERVRKRLRRKLAKEADGIFLTYQGWIKDDPATCRHAVDKLLPDEKKDGDNAPTININFVRFDHTVQLQAEGVPTAILASNGSGHQTGGQGVAPAQRQGQNGLKFLDFKDVS